jgi:hypothetical protein
MCKSMFSGIALFAATAVLSTTTLSSAVNVSITPADSGSLLGYMNVFELPANGGGFVFGQPWGVGDLRANFVGSELKIEAAPIPTADGFWYQNGTGGAGAAGNKQMDANVYIQNDALAGDTVTFSGTVSVNSFVSGYTSVAFIKEFAPDYSSFTQVTVPLDAGNFSISKSTAPGTHVQYGYETMGANVWPDDVGSKGFVSVGALVIVPEPTALAGLAGGSLLLRRRRA